MAEIEVPEDLPEILRGFTVSVLRHKPADIIDYAVDYFLKIQKSRTIVDTDENSVKNRRSSKGKTVAFDNDQLPARGSVGTGERTSFDSEKMISIGTTPDINLGGLSDAESLSSDENYSNEEGDTFPEYDLLRRNYVKLNDQRRVSVAAERYNPEDDDESDQEELKIYPKTVEQRQRLKDAVKMNLLFRSLETKQIDQILDAMWEQRVHRGDSIIREGDDGDHFYIIDHGLYSVYVNKTTPVKIAEYRHTGSFGELALMYNQQRSATVVADTDGVLWVMGRQTFRKLVLKHAFRKRKLYETFLKDLNILQSLTHYERSNVADALIPTDVDQNEVIVKQGDPGDRMFFIEEGQCDVYMNGKFHKRLSRGDYFGELALLNHEPRSATVIAASFKVRLASLEVQSFERLLGPCLDLMQRESSKYLK